MSYLLGAIASGEPTKSNSHECETPIQKHKFTPRAREISVSTEFQEEESTKYCRMSTVQLQRACLISQIKAAEAQERAALAQEKVALEQLKVLENNTFNLLSL